MGLLKDLEREPINELTASRVLQLKDCVYFYNAQTDVISTYTICDEGFIYSVIRYARKELIKQFNFIYMNRSNKGFLAKELNEQEFNEFTNQIAVLQEQAHAFKPLVSFENYIDIIKQKMLW